MHQTYKTEGTCSTKIDFDIVDGKIYNVEFTGGCNGNLKGIAALVEGQNADEVKDKLEGIKCGMKNTSCPDQLSKAISEKMKHEE